MLGLNEAAHIFVRNVMLGDIAFFKETGDRIDGKAQQSVQLGGDPDGVPVKTEINVHFRGT